VDVLAGGCHYQNDAAPDKSHNADINESALAVFPARNPVFQPSCFFRKSMLYSTRKQNGVTLSNIDKIEERQPINIGNDVFIGMNVTILDGVKIGALPV
jgi:acetyltransferase-like isoleucine patch superfamily enzyme